MRANPVIVAALSCLLPTAAAQLPPAPKEGDTQQEPKPRLFVVQRSVDIGTVVEGDEVSVYWILENRGDADLVIEQTKSSCGCTTVVLYGRDRVIPPGQSLKLTAQFDSTRRRGRQTKNVGVFSNDPIEPQLKLEFTAHVETLYEIKPAGVLNLRALQRGKAAAETLDVIPGSRDHKVEILSVSLPRNLPLTYDVEIDHTALGTIKRIRFAPAVDAPLGRLNAKARIKLQVGDIRKERSILIRGEVVGDLAWQPKVVDATRAPSMRGKRLAPVTLRSADKTPFDILNVSGGSLLETTYQPAPNSPAGTVYSIYVTIREDAVSGPFGSLLEVRTSSLNQPVVQVPVFGIVAPPVQVNPPVVLLRQDGSAEGAKRRVRLRASPQASLDIGDIVCDNSAVTVSLERTGQRQGNVRYIEVALAAKLPKGTHQSTVVITTSVEGAERLEIPVTIHVPG